jgi:predicted GNAT superfamily acetyltransferase
LGEAQDKKAALSGAQIMARTKKAKFKGAEKAPVAIVVRQCHGLAEFGACLEIQRAVWASADADLTPLPIFVVAAETGGQVLGAFAEDRMVGFTLALAGMRGRDKLGAPSAPYREPRRSKPFLHSHMTAVLEAWRDRGIGRSLKLLQREDALSRGIEMVEWTFDPLQIKNAYFNLVRLGAIARRYLPNQYGLISSPLQAGLPTDRLVAEWQLRSARVRRGVAARPERKRAISLLRAASTARTRIRGRGQAVHIRVPAELASLRHTRPEEAARLQAEIRQEFEHWLNLGYAATSVTVAGQGGEYLLQPWPKG